MGRRAKVGDLITSISNCARALEMARFQAGNRLLRIPKDAALHGSRTDETLAAQSSEPGGQSALEKNRRLDSVCFQAHQESENPRKTIVMG